jgi:sugar phosphate permease
MGLPSKRPTNVRWAVFALACGTSWWMYLHRYAFGAIKPNLEKEWGLDTLELGLLESAFSFSYSLFQFPLGVAADAFGAHLVLTGLMILWCLGLGMQASASSPKYFWYAQVTVGVGQSAAYAAINRIARVWYPPTIRTTLQGISGILAGRVGGMCANLFIVTLLIGVLQLNWRTAVYVLAAGGLAHAAMFFVIFRNSPHKHPLVNASEEDLIDGAKGGSDAGLTPPRMTIGQMLRGLKLRAFVNLACLNVQSILSTFADAFYSGSTPLFLWQVYRLEDQERGFYASLPLFGGAIGGVVGGLLNDFFVARTGNLRWSRSGVAFVGKGMAAVLLFSALLFYENPYVFCGILFLVKLFGDWSLTTSWGVVTDIGGRATASVFAFNNAVAGLGLIAAGATFGYLARDFGWPTVIVSVASAYAFCALSWLTIDCTIPVIAEANSPRAQQ